MAASNDKQQAPGNWGVMSQADMRELAAWRELSEAWQGQVNDALLTPSEVPPLSQDHWPMDVRIVGSALAFALDAERKQSGKARS